MAPTTPIRSIVGNPKTPHSSSVHGPSSGNSTFKMRTLFPGTFANTIPDETGEVTLAQQAARQKCLTSWPDAPTAETEFPMPNPGTIGLTKAQAQKDQQKYERYIKNRRVELGLDQGGSTRVDESPFVSVLNTAKDWGFEPDGETQPKGTRWDYLNLESSLKPRVCPVPFQDAKYRFVEAFKQHYPGTSLSQDDSKVNYGGGKNFRDEIERIKSEESSNGRGGL